MLHQKDKIANFVRLSRSTRRRPESPAWRRLSSLTNAATSCENHRDGFVDNTGSRLADLATLLQVWRELAGRADEELDRIRALRASARPSWRARE
jgi:hypothetical protein